MALSRTQVLRYRTQVQQLTGGVRDLTEAAVLDIGVQDTGADGASWALANRGVGLGPPDERRDRLEAELALAWTLRGAPHFYRRGEIAAVAAATAPFSEADARKRVFDAAKPLRAAGIDMLDALDEVGKHMHDLARRPIVKGEMSTALTARLSEPYLRYCRSCAATHCYEQPFRLAALRAGVELEPGTSPPVMRRIKGWKGPARRVPPALDPVRAYLHLLGPATPPLVAEYLDAPVKDVQHRWPDDAVEVDMDGVGDGGGATERRWILDSDRASLEDPDVDPGLVRLLSAFDLFLQTRDRALLVPDAGRRKQLWVVLGRPGAVMMGGDIVGTWRPRTAGKKFRLAVDTWRSVPQDALVEQAERLAAHRGVSFAGFVRS